MIRLKGTRFTVSRQGVINGSATFFADTLSEAIGSDLPNPFGYGTFISRTGGEWDAETDRWILTANYEGLVGEVAASNDDYSLDAEFSEEPIESHPEIQTLMERYSGTRRDDGRVEFAETIEGRATGGTGLSNARRGSQKNPMFGVTSYPAMRMVASHTYVRPSIPGSVYRKVGTVLKSLPSGFDEPGGRAWIVMPPLARRRGDAWEITERYRDIGDEPHAEILAQLVQR